jgi:hypothetical protein
LPYRIFDQIRQVEQGTVVTHKRLEYLVRKAGQWWVQRGDAVDFLWRHGRDPLGACHRLSPTWTPCPLTA